MTNFLRSLRYLEHAITVAAFAEDHGRKALEHPASSDDLVEVALRHASAAQRDEYVKAAEPLVAVSACNAGGPPFRPFMSSERSTDAWTTLEATTAFIATNARH